MELIVPRGHPPMRLSQYLPMALPDWPAWAVRQTLQKRQVKRQGIRLEADTLVFPQDRLTVYLPPKVQPKRRAIPIVYEDAQVLVVEKPAGISVREGDAPERSLEEVMRQQTGREALWACHRLDIHTGGLLLMAKTESSLEYAQQAFAEGHVHKAYVCRVVGTPMPTEASLEAYLRKDARAARVEVRPVPFPGAKRIATRYRVLSAGDIARLRVEILTGRTHQIRAHLAALGHPVLGDDKYGNREANRLHHIYQQQLWAVELRVDDARLPELFGQVLTSTPPF